MSEKFNTILVKPSLYDDPRIASIQLNRPQALNAITSEMLEEVVAALEKLDSDPQVRVIILNGNDKAFAAGADIKMLVERDPITQLKDNRSTSWQRFSQIKKPIIAAVNGFALGGGCELAMACDLIIAGDKAKFGQPEINIGTIPGAGGTQRLTRLVGKSKAMQMVLTGELIDAFTAEKWGIVARVVPASTLVRASYELAKLMANKSPLALQLAKEAINQSYETHLAQGLGFERRNFFLTFASKDQKEGMKAFLEKRQPHYEGN